MDSDSDFLRTCTGGANDADRSAPDDVGEAEGDTVHDGSAAIGPHDHEIVLARILFESQFALGWHVVAEQHDIHPKTERLHRLGRRIVARHRDQREIVRGVFGDGHLDAGENLSRPGRLIIPTRGFRG